MPRIGFSPATKGTYSKEVDIPADNLGLPNDFPPSLVDQDNITLYAFTVDTDRMTLKFEITPDYAGGDIDLFVMWTNDGGVDDNGLNAKWEIAYQVSDEGEAVSGSHANSPKTVEDTYASDSGFIEHWTDVMTIAAADFFGKHHMFLKLRAITVADPLTCDPHLICLCFMYTATWGRKP